MVVRAALVYVLLLVAMRMMGKRVAAQLSITELAVILMLGAAIGVPIQVSSQGILPAAIVLFTVVALQRMSSRAGLRWRKFQVAQEGDVTMLVKDGRILLDELKTSEVSREMLASELRAANVAHPGTVAPRLSGVVRFYQPRVEKARTPRLDGSTRHGVLASRCDRRRRLLRMLELRRDRRYREPADRTVLRVSFDAMGIGGAIAAGSRKSKEDRMKPLKENYKATIKTAIKRLMTRRESRQVPCRSSALLLCGS